MCKICFAASSGGHLEQLLMLKPLMEKYDSFILTEDTSYEVKINIRKYFVNQINRREKFLIINLFVIFIKTFKIYINEKPDLIISTGTLSTIPICLIAKLFKKKVIYIESFAKINSPTLTGKLLYKFADLFIIQWKNLRKYYKDATYGGSIY